MHLIRGLQDKLARISMLALACFAGLLVLLMALGLYLRSWPILESMPLMELLLSSSWHPLKGEFGLLPFLAGTVWVTGVSIVIAVPFSLLCAMYLAEYAPTRIREWVKPLVDLLAGIPSVVYGICGILIIVPLIKDYFAPLFGSFSTGYSVLAGGVVLAVMVFPIIIHVSLEVFASVPYEVREASLALGATRWQTTKKVVMRRAMPGILAAAVLGLSRAFGETMAVLMVAGNVARVPKSLLDPAYPLPALIANNYGEMMSVPLYDSALMLASLVLLLVVLFFNVLSRLILIRIERGIQ
ncbi:MAG: phosphate ABC transporter permease subunit PstC [Fidelibacterota bacterium]|nr:MAG: phosphate ABC transporter permease subunit PstC [Candidatus Neomarinimicrobiota bacterium]